MKLIYRTIGDILQYNALQRADEEAAVFIEQNVRFTWSELNKLVDDFAKGLLAIGMGKRSHIAVWGTNIPEWLITQLAVAKIGGILVTINPEWKEKELEYALQQSDTAALVMMPGFEKQGGNKTFSYDYIRILSNLCPNEDRSDGFCPDRFPALKQVILMSDETTKEGVNNWQEIIEKGKIISDNVYRKTIFNVDPESPVMIQYTSGTTGFPKGAVLTQYNIINNALAAMEHMGVTCSDRLCGPVPYYHCFGSILVNIGCLVSGATMVIPWSYFDGHKTLEAIEREKCTILYGVPTMFINELDDMDFESFNLTSLRTGIMAGAPVDRELYEAVTQKMGAKEMTIAYGLTETSPVTHQTQISDPVEKRITTVGKPIEHTEAKIVDPETLKELGPNEVGEIWMKGFHVMKGYYKRPEETEKTIVDGWIRSGDLGVKDEEGYYRIVGRLKEMIIVGGHNVYPAEVEQSLHSLLEDKIEFVQVVGIPHPKLQEVVALVAKCIPGESLTLEEVQNRCEGKLEWPKIPRYLKVMDDFTSVMTVTGKIQKFKIQELLKKEVQKDAAVG